MTPIKIPASYITGQAVYFADENDCALLVSDNSPLPVNVTHSVPAPLAGTTQASSLLGPFFPAVDRNVILVLAGDWSGQIQVLRSSDGGASMVPVTLGGAPWALFGANCCEPVWQESEAGATLYLDAFITSGTLTYRPS